MMLETNRRVWYNAFVAASYTGNRKEVLLMEILISIIIAVVADLISLLIRKWLDSDE